MAWNDIDPGSELIAGTAGTATVYNKLWANHDELYQLYAPAFYGSRDVSETNTAATQRYAFTVRGNYDLQPIVFRFRAVATVGSGTVRFYAGGTSSTANIVGAEAWYSISVTPTQPDVRCRVDCNVTVGGDAITMRAYEVYLNPSAPAAGTLASRFRKAYAPWYATSAPVASEHIARMMNGPPYIAADRPSCVSHHMTDVGGSIGAKTPQHWGTTNNTTPDVVGDLRLFRCDTRRRTYTLDAYTTQTGTGATFRIHVGAYQWAITPSSTAEWATTRLELDPADFHDITASITAGAGNTAAVRTFQAWRL